MLFILSLQKKRNTMQQRIIFIFTSLFLSLSVYAQQQANVLFIGNSYTEVNNLPKMTADIANSMGYEMTWSSNTPGGCTFSQHCNNQSMTLIRQGVWDFVVLQEQSQYPSFPQSQVEAEVFPYAQQLVDSVYANNPCAEPMFYMTWGRKNGDAQNAQYFPVLGTYEGMDSMLYTRYMYMAEVNDASVCPVGRVWRFIRENYPDIELYKSDDSHPSLAGTYAGACAFFVMFFHEDPENISFVPSSLNQETAQTIRQAVHEVVYNQQELWQRQKPQAEIETLEINNLTVSLIAHTTMADEITWDFGDGTIINNLLTDTSDSIITHNYLDTGFYQVMLIASRHCITDTTEMTLHIVSDNSSSVNTLSVENDFLNVFPNPSSSIPVVILNGQKLKPSDITVITADGKESPFVQEIPKGVVTLRVIKDGEIYFRKFIKL